MDCHILLKTLSMTKLDPLLHAALRFVTNSPFRTHHCTLYAAVGWSSLTARRLQHWYNFIYKAILGDLPSYISSKFKLVRNGLNLRSNAWLRCEVPSFSSEGGKKCLSFFGPWSWNDLQTRLKLAALIPLRSFKRITLNIFTNNCTCQDVN